MEGQRRRSSAQPAKLVVIEELGTDTLHDNEEVVRVISALEAEETRVVASPVGCLPVRDEEVGLKVAIRFE